MENYISKFTIGSQFNRKKFKEFNLNYGELFFTKEYLKGRKIKTNTLKLHCHEVFDFRVLEHFDFENLVLEVGIFEIFPDFCCSVENLKIKYYGDEILSLNKVIKHFDYENIEIKASGKIIKLDIGNLKTIDDLRNICCENLILFGDKIVINRELCAMFRISGEIKLCFMTVVIGDDLKEKDYGFFIIPKNMSAGKNSKVIGQFPPYNFY